MFEVKNLKFSAGAKDILNGLNLHVSDKNIHCIIGENGTGKSTLAYIIMGLTGYEHYEGEVLFQGEDIRKWDITERAKHGITLAWQQPASFEGLTVREYLRLSSKTRKMDDIRQALTDVGLNPDLYLGRMVCDELSGGERKRIELASIVLFQPKLAIIDEPDSGIDLLSISLVVKNIEKIKEAGGSVLLITHREEMLAGADMATLICSGKDLLHNKPDIVKTYYMKNCNKCEHPGRIKEHELERFKNEL